METVKKPRQKASTKLAKEVEGLRASFQELTKLVTGIVAKLEASEKQHTPVNPSPFSKAPPPTWDRPLGTLKDGEMTAYTRIKDMLNPKAIEESIPANSIVQIREDSPLAKVYRLDAKGNPVPKDKLGSGESYPAFARVRKYLHTTKGGQKKYRVEIPGFSRMEGILENEVTLCPA